MIALRRVTGSPIVTPAPVAAAPATAAAMPSPITAAAPTPSAASAPAPAAVAPAPMTAAAPAAMTAAAPAHLFRRELIGLFLRRDRGLCIGAAGTLVIFIERLRHQRCGLRTCGQGGRAGKCTKCEFEKIPAFHGVVPLLQWRVMPKECRLAEMNAR